jgi:uridine kinase
VDEWPDRFKAMTTLLRSGRGEDVTLLVRWLHERRAVAGLAAAEERLLDKAEAALMRVPDHDQRLGVAFSTSTWLQPVPATSSPTRARVVDRVAAAIDAIGSSRLRVAIDGLTAAGKTSFGHELAGALVERGRQALRACLDDFKRPWSEAHLYDRTSGEGYYRNAFDLESAPGADGVVALCSIDPLTQLDHSTAKTLMSANGVLIVDGTFACRPELDVYWDFRIWLEIDSELSVRRGTQRDAAMEGDAKAAERLHRDRYLTAEQLYIAEVDPCSFVEAIVDNADFSHPILVRLTT